MTGALILLAIGYALIAVLLLSLHLKSAWSWRVKALAIGAALPFLITTFAALQAMIGWPSAGALPENFQLHAALVREPAPKLNDAGAIFLWLTEAAEAEAQARPAELEPQANHGEGPPRAFVLPYSREMHEKVEAMQEAMRKGEAVAGRHRPGSSMERRFAQPAGDVELFTPPPPPLPSKDG